MNWRRGARVAVAVVGLGTAVAVYFLSRPRLPVVRPETTTPSDPSASIQSGRGQDLRFNDKNEVVADFTYASQKHYPDGRLVYEDGKLLLPDGTVVSAKEIEARGKAPEGSMPAEWALRRDVRFAASENLSLAGAEGSYNHVTGVASIPGPVAFTRGRVAGSGRDGRYDRNSGMFQILADAKMTMAADDQGQGGVEATSRELSFVRGSKSMIFEGSPRLGRPSETLTADSATVYLSDDEQQFRAIELRGNAVVAPTPGKTTALPEMRAMNITLTFHAGGQALERGTLAGGASLVFASGEGRRSITAAHINFSTAPDGRTLTRLEGGGRVTVTLPAGNGVPERTITGQSLVASGNDKEGLRQALFDGNAQFTEVSPAGRGTPLRRRTGTSQTLALAMRGEFDAIDRAEFRQNVRFQDGDTMTGDADLGIYHATKGELELHPLTRNARQMRVQDGGVTIDASEYIKVNLNSRDLQARRDVKTVRAGEPAGAANRPAGLFSRTDKWYGSAYAFEYDASDKVLRYVGTTGAPARVWQSESSINASDISVSEDRLDLKASGHVDSTFVITTGERTASSNTPSRYRVTADALIYNDANRTATYTGTPASMKREEGETRALTLVFVMDPRERRIQRLEASGNVRTALPNGRDGVGDQLIYESSADEYTLKGSPEHPLILQWKDGNGTCTIAKGTLARLTSAVGSPNFPAHENDPGGSRIVQDQACTDLLKP